MADKNRVDVFGDKQLVLFQNVVRGKVNPTWQAKISTLSAFGGVRVSLQTTDSEEAKTRVRAVYFMAEARAQSFLPLQAARFDKTTCVV